jgi:hypothetical protein
VVELPNIATREARRSVRNRADVSLPLGERKLDAERDEGTAGEATQPRRPSPVDS